MIRVWRLEEWWVGYLDSNYRQLGRYSETSGWQIKDTMGLINDLRRRLEASQERDYRFEQLHEAAKQVILHYACPQDKKGWATFMQFDVKYVKLWRKYGRP